MRPDHLVDGRLHAREAYFDEPTSASTPIGGGTGETQVCVPSRKRKPYPLPEAMELLFFATFRMLVVNLSAG